MGFQDEPMNIHYPKASFDVLKLDEDIDINKLRKNGYFHSFLTRKSSISIQKLHKNRARFLKDSLQLLSHSKNTRPLKSISIDIQKTPFTPQERMKMIYFFRKIKNLTKFQFIKRWDIVITNPFLHRLSQCILRFSSLREFTFTLYGCNEIQTINCIRLAKALSRNKTLESIDLCLIGCSKVNIKGIQCLFSQIGKLEHLKEIRLDLSNLMCLKEKPSYLDFEKALGKLGKLEKLTLSMSHANFEERGIQSLSKSLSHFKTLKTLELGLGFCPLSVTGISSLSESLSVLTDLEELSLEFWSCTNVTDEGVSSLAKSLKNLTCLKRLELNFSRCQEVADWGFCAIFNSISHMKDLEKLDLFLFTCQIGECGVSDLKDLLLGMKKLKSIEINLGGCALIHDETVYDLKQKFEERSGSKDILKVHR